MHVKYNISIIISSYDIANQGLWRPLRKDFFQAESGNL